MKRVLERLGLLLLGVAVALVLGEGAARLVWPSATQEPEAREEASPDLPELITLSDFARPNGRGRMRCGGLYRSNSAGFRGPEIPIRKAPGSFRIALAGDSLTMGSCVEERETYAMLLEKALNERGYEGRRYEVLNLGMAGSNIHHVVIRARRIGLRFGADMIVYGWTANDIEGPAYETSCSPEARAKWKAGYRRFDGSPSYLLRVLWPRWQSLRDALDPPRESYQYEVMWNYFQNPEAWADFTAELDRWAQIQAKHDLCVIIFLHTNLYYLNFLHPFRAIYHRVAEAAEERGLVTIGSFDVHRGHRAEALWARPHDPHPNATGHRLLARALLAGLKELPPHCWR